MKKIIFNDGFGAYDPSEPFILLDKDLTVALENLPVPAAVGKHFLIFTNEDGEERKHELSGSDVITIPRDFLKPGQLISKVIKMVRDKTVKTWLIEPLLIMQLDTHIEVSPVIAALRAELAELKNTIAAKEYTRDAQIKVLTQTVDALREDIQKAMTAMCESVLDSAMKADAGIFSELKERLDAALTVFEKLTQKKKRK